MSFAYFFILFLFCFFFCLFFNVFFEEDSYELRNKRDKYKTEKRKTIIVEEHIVGTLIVGFFNLKNH